MCVGRPLRYTSSTFFFFFAVRLFTLYKLCRAKFSAKSTKTARFAFSSSSVGTSVETVRISQSCKRRRRVRINRPCECYNTVYYYRPPLKTARDSGERVCVSPREHDLRRHSISIVFDDSARRRVVFVRPRLFARSRSAAAVNSPSASLCHACVLCGRCLSVFFPSFFRVRNVRDLQRSCPFVFRVPDSRVLRVFFSKPTRCDRSVS